MLTAVFAKGQTVTGPYRFLARYGGYVWLETSASVVTKSAFEEQEIVVCVNHTIGLVPNSLFSSPFSCCVLGIRYYCYYGRSRQYRSHQRFCVCLKAKTAKAKIAKCGTEIVHYDTSSTMNIRSKVKISSYSSKHLQTLWYCVNVF